MKPEYLTVLEKLEASADLVNTCLQSFDVPKQVADHMLSMLGNIKDLQWHGSLLQVLADLKEINDKCINLAGSIRNSMQRIVVHPDAGDVLSLVNGLQLKILQTYQDVQKVIDGIIEDALKITK